MKVIFLIATSLTAPYNRTFFQKTNANIRWCGFYGHLGYLHIASVHNFEDFRGLAQFFFLVSMQTDKAQDMIDGVNGDSDLHRHQGVHRHWIVIVFHCCCCFDAGAASGQLFMHGLVTLPQHLFQNKSLTLSVTFNIIVKRLFFWISSNCNWCFRMSTGSLPQQLIQNKYLTANAAVSILFK